MLWRVFLSSDRLGFAGKPAFFYPQITGREVLVRVEKKESDTIGNFCSTKVSTMHRHTQTTRTCNIYVPANNTHTTGKPEPATETGSRAPTRRSQKKQHTQHFCGLNQRRASIRSSSQLYKVVARIIIVVHTYKRRRGLCRLVTHRELSNSKSKTKEKKVWQQHQGLATRPKDQCW